MSKQQSDPKQGKKRSRNHKLKKWIISAVVVIAVAGVAWAKFSSNSGFMKAEALFTVRKGHLPIFILESGKVQANKSETLTCELEGQSTIISIVSEGTYAKEGDVLVELDSSDLRDKIDQQKLTVNAAQSAFQQANEAHEIQKNQNESDIKAAQLAVDFAKIDLDKYSGGDTGLSKAEEVARLALDFAKLVFDKYAREELGEEGTNPDAGKQDNNQTNPDETEQKSKQLLEKFAEIGPEGGDWHQQLRTALYDIVSRDTALKLAKDKVEGTRELKKKNYVTETQLKTDESSFRQAVIDLKKVAEAMRLLIEYDHPKQLAKLTADYAEAKKELERATRKAASALAQKKSDLDGKQAAYEMQQGVLDKLQDQLEKAIIKAPQPGLVIYASSTAPWYRRDEELIAEGRPVRQRQKLIELPDVSVMKVEVNVHESVLDIIKKGQKAIVTVEAVPGLTLRGHVEKVAILPDSRQSWMNPDLTVYPTTIIIDENSDALKPGMTAKVEIIIADLTGVLHVPVQAVTVRDEREVCFLAKGSTYEVTPVEVGLSNDNYVEIKSGLKKGDKILLYAPIAAEEKATQRKFPETESEKEEGKEEKEKEKEEKPETTPAEETPEQANEAEGILDALPQEMQDKAKAALQSLSAEQRKEVEQTLKELGKDGKIDLQNLTPEQRKKFGEMMMKLGGGGPRDRRPTGSAPPEDRRPGRRSGRPPGGPPRALRMRG